MPEVTCPLCSTVIQDPSAMVLRRLSVYRNLIGGRRQALRVLRSLIRVLEALPS